MNPRSIQNKAMGLRANRPKSSAPFGLFRNRPMRASRRLARRGSVLIFVIIVSAVLIMSMSYLLSAIRDARQTHGQRIAQDQAFEIAEAGLTQAVAWLSEQVVPPVDQTTLDNIALIYRAPSKPAKYTSDPNFVNPYDRFNLTVKYHYQAQGYNEAYWTITSTAAYQGGAGVAMRPFNRRVQATFHLQNFGEYEQFVNSSKIYAQGALYVMGLNKVFFGKVHSNTGVGLFPNLWFLEKFSTSVSGNPPNREYNNYNEYLKAVYQNPTAANFMNILKYWNANFRYEPVFYNGYERRDDVTTLPDIKVDIRARNLRQRAGLKLPADMTNYDPLKGPNFDIELVDATAGSQNDGTVKIRQFLGYDNTTNPPTPLYSDPPLILSVASLNGGLTVEGDIVSLKGTLDGQLTIGAFPVTDGDGKGQINITGDLQYASRLASSDFKYSNDVSLFIDGPDNDGDGYPDTRDIDFTAVKELKDVVNSEISDILGLVADGNVTVKEKDLAGNLVVPLDGSIHLDGVVMATGRSTLGDTNDGYYQVENYRSRPKGSAYVFGGNIQNQEGVWANMTGGRHLAGLKQVGSLFDFRTLNLNGSPPHFPNTGQYEMLENSWREGFVERVNQAPVWLPIQ